MIEPFFNNKELNILVKYNSQKELTEKEIEDLDNWVIEYKHREELFNKLKNTIEVQTVIEAMNEADIESVLIKLKKFVPQEYIIKTEDKDIFLIRSCMLTGIQDYGNALLIKLIKDHIWWGIISLNLALFVVLLFIYFIIRIS